MDEALQKTKQTYFHDRFLSRTVLRLIPGSVTPNQVTIFRFLMTPLVVWLIYEGYFAWGLPIFAIVAFSDAVDGSMARTRDQITSWGIVFDPIADKLLVGSVLVALLIRNVSVYLAFSIILVEAIVGLAGLYSHRRGTVYMANYLGKIKMVLQVFGLGFLIIGLWLQNEPIATLSTVMLAVSLFFAVANIVAFGVRRAI